MSAAIIKPTVKIYVAFDLLRLGGQCLMDEPLAARRRRLQDILPDNPAVAACEGVVGDGKAYFAEVVAAGHEGVVAKRLSSRYLPNRQSSSWRKIKQKMKLPCVVIGYRLQGKALRDLVLASMVDGNLAFVGTVELGVDGRDLERLEALRIAKPAVPCSLTARWVRLELFGEVHFAGWRPNGMWRDAIFTGWGKDG